MQPRPPDEETAAARGAVEVCAMPARRMGCWTWRRVVRGVVRGGVGEGDGEAMVRRWWRYLVERIMKAVVF